MKRIIIYVISGLLILLFLYSGLTKFFNLSEFGERLNEIPIINIFSNWLAWLVPTLELLIIPMLLIKQFRLRGFYFSFSMMVLFTSYIIYLNLVTHDIPCSCGGFLEQMPVLLHLFFNVFLAVISLAGIYLEKKIYKKQPEKSTNFMFI